MPIMGSNMVWVDDWTEREEYDLIFNQLNDHWKLQVAREEKNAQKRQLWVKMTNMKEGVDVRDFRDTLQAWIDMPVREIQQIPHGYLIECGSEEVKSRVMSFNGVELDHRVVKVTSSEKSMTGTQIFDFVAQGLQLSEDVRDSSTKKRQPSYPVETASEVCGKYTQG